MGLLQKAVETYDHFVHLAGVVCEGNKIPLPPISHWITSSDIEITLDRDGNFLTARGVKKDEPKIVYPVTEESANRTSSPAAHPLCDQICYVASYDEKKYGLYVKQLEEWQAFDSENVKLRAILKYVKTGSILHDLEAAQMIRLKDGKPDKEKLFIRWKVEDGMNESDCWKDRKLFESYIEFYHARSENSSQRLCMITGSTTHATEGNAKGIVSAFGNAKLISSNDDQGFTYRGRFDEAWQAATISYQASQKAHNALMWLISNQGTRQGNRIFLCWSPSGKRIPQPLLPLLEGREIEPLPELTDYKKKLQRTLLGYRTDLPKQEQVILAAFGAATTGRLALTYYGEYMFEDFLKRLMKWDESCCWINGQYGIQSPGIYQIVRYAFGTQRNEKIEKPKDEMFGQQIQRLMACRVNGAGFPENIERNLVRQASNLSILEKNERFRLLHITCACIRKYHIDWKKEEMDMILDDNCNDRSYLFGRLLAIAEKAEADTYTVTGAGGRETNAMRYQLAFSQRPLSTWRFLEERLNPYYNRLPRGRANYYKKLIASIMEKMNISVDESKIKSVWNKKLDDIYLIGYYHQRAALYTKKDEKKNMEV